MSRLCKQGWLFYFRHWASFTVWKIKLKNPHTQKCHDYFILDTGPASLHMKNKNEKATQKNVMTWIYLLKKSVLSEAWEVMITIL